MTDRAVLKVMKCPTCGANLKAMDANEEIVCVYCGNTIVPVSDHAIVSAKETVGNAFNGIVKVEGIKTSSSALAYLDIIFEEYDWEIFSYAQVLSVAEIDDLAKSLKVSSADDKNTWFVCFKSIAVPFIHKISGCKKIFAEVIEDYKADNLDAYSKFDAYKRVSGMITANKDELVSELQKITAKAGKYGATSAELNELNNDIESIKSLANLNVYSDIEEIAEIKSFIIEKNTKITEALAAEGINAEETYLCAKQLIDEKQYVKALDVLQTLKGYSDTAQLIEKIDRYYTISDVVEIAGNLYSFKNEPNSNTVFELRPVVDGKISHKPIIKDITRIVTNYADVLYYIDLNNRLMKYSFSEKKSEKIFSRIVSDEPFFAYGRRIFLQARDSEYSNRKLIELDTATGTVKILIEKIKKIVSVVGNILAYIEDVESQNQSANKEFVKVIDVDTLKITELGTKKIEFEGLIGTNVVYTQHSPVADNKDLYIKSISTDDPARIVEKNILNFCDIVDGKLFYYIGNNANKSLIKNNCEGTERKELPMYIKQILFARGGWMYFIRSVGYNSVLCKSKMDGSKFTVIAADIDKFVEIKNGYFYYINSQSALVKVRMDGSNMQYLCDNVESVLSVKEDKIVFISIDSNLVRNELNQIISHSIKSIYAVDFVGGGKIKLAYDVKAAKAYDENTIRYVVAKGSVNPNAVSVTKFDQLHTLNVLTNESEVLLEMKSEEKKGGCYIATAVYGSYDCPQVWTLRRFRDDTLAETWYGRAFIKTYYAISPTLVKWFGETKWFKGIWKSILDRMVSSLIAEGVKNTPYNDRNW